MPDALDRRRTLEGDHARLTEAYATAMTGLQRLASLEGFEGAGEIKGDSFAERELRARGKYAVKKLAEARQVRRGVA